MTKKVYDLAKEFNVPSKDFVTMLQEANLPIKNHMSAISDLQEKYFRINYVVDGGKMYKRSEYEEKKAAAAAAPEPQTESAPAKKPQAEAPQKTPAKPAEAPARQAQKPQGAQTQGTAQRRDNQTQGSAQRRDSQSQGTYQRRDNQSQGSYQRRDNQTQGSYQRRDNQSQGSYQRRDNQSQGSYQRRDNQSQGSYQRRDNQSQGSYQRRDNQSQGSYQRRDNQSQGSYQRRDNQSQGSYQRRDNQTQGSYQRRDNQSQGSYQRRDNQLQGTYQRRDGQNGQNRTGYQSQRQNSRPAAEEKPLEKSKNDRSKVNAKQKNEAKNKNRESFFDEKPVSRLDNTKKKHGSKSQYRVEKAEKKEKRATSGVTGTVTVPEAISVSELSQLILLAPSEIIKTLMSYGIMASMNQTLDFDTVSIICEELGISVELEKEEDIFARIEEEHFADPDALRSRPPIVTVMGHVDHGKTSLLDAIRQTNVTKGESGGITQHIGAYTVEMHGKPITFIDTPGHAAFTAMRSRGASVTDIAVLVVAADDGVMPQTVEAINHAKAAGVPIVVAINKMDKATANPDRVKQELTEHNVVCEDYGGDVICVPVSAKTGEGLDTLLDMILLVAEVEDLKANPDREAIGTVIESRIDKQRGITASLLVKSGTLHEGDYIVIGASYGKVRVMTDHNGKKIISAGPSMAVEVLGLPEVPGAGDKFFVVENEKEAKKITDRRKDRERILAAKASGPKSLEDIFNKVSEGELKEIPVIIKTDVAGSYEAIKQELEKLNDNDDGIRIRVLHGGVGEVTETDAQLASASSAIIIAFNVKTDNKARAVCEKEGIEVRSYSVIYDIINDITAAMKGLKEPEYEEIVTGQGQIRATFRIPNLGLIAGSYITDECVKRSDKIRVIRGGQVIHDGSISSLKRFQDDVKEVQAGYECGIGIEKFTDLAEDDVLEFYSMREITE